MNPPSDPEREVTESSDALDRWLERDGADPLDAGAASMLEARRALNEDSPTAGDVEHLVRSVLAATATVGEPSVEKVAPDRPRSNRLWVPAVAAAVLLVAAIGATRLWQDPSTLGSSNESANAATAEPSSDDSSALDSTAGPYESAPEPETATAEPGTATAGSANGTGNDDAVQAELAQPGDSLPTTTVESAGASPSTTAALDTAATSPFAGVRTTLVIPLP